MAAKKTRKTQVPTARLVFLICAIALGFGAWFLTSTSSKILKTQWKMCSYYCDITKANDQHDYFYDMARTYPQGGYMHSAEEWDEKAEALKNERSTFVATATDPVVKWACRDQCEALTILAGLAELIVGIALWVIDLYMFRVFVAATITAKRQRATRRAHRNQAAAPYRTR